MMHEVQTPEGKLFWLDDLEDPIMGSAIVVIKLREAARGGLEAFYPAAPVVINLKNFSDVRFALEVLYGDQAKFSPDAPPATEFYEPFDPNVIY